MSTEQDKKYGSDDEQGSGRTPMSTMLLCLSHGGKLLEQGPSVFDFDFVTWILSVCLECPGAVTLVHVTYFNVPILSFLGYWLPSFRYHLS